jgi:hypothetical protein
MTPPTKSDLEGSSRAFDLHRNGEMLVIAKRNEHVVDGIVTGIITDLLAFPLFSIAFILGVWLIVGTLSGKLEGQWAPSFDHFASPAIVRAAGAVLTVLMGIMFAGGAFFLFRFFLKSQPGLFPFECHFKRNGVGEWIVRQKLWFLVSRWRTLGRDWQIWCFPTFLRGDWGYKFFIRRGKTLLQLAAAGSYAERRNHAEADAKKDLDRLCALFGVCGELKRWG